MRRKASLVLAAVSLVCAAAPPSPADTLSAAADTQTSSVQPTLGFGNLPAMAVRKGARGSALISYLRFDVSTLASEAGVAPAVLRLWVRSVVAPGTIEVLPVLGPWQEGTVTARSAPELGAPVAVFAIEEGHASQFVDVDVAGLVREWAAGSLENHGLALRADGAANVSFHTREGFLTSHAPSLEVMRTDGPASAAAVPHEPDGVFPPSRIPAGSVMFFDLAACPNGWSPFVEARGRIVIGLHPGGALRGTVGTALPDLTPRTVSAVAEHTHTVTNAAESAHTHTVTVNAEAAHTHSVTVDTESAHTHSVDPASFNTPTGEGTHTHTTNTAGSSHDHDIPAWSTGGVSTRVDWVNNGGGTNNIPTTGSGTHTHGVNTTGSAHVHSIDVPATTSLAGTSHTHTATAGAGTSHTHTATAGAGSSHTHAATASATGVPNVDVTMPYVQLLACRKN
jgi:hypothetical protein